MVSRLFYFSINMNTFDVIFIIVLLIISILCIILFFKIWGMCNDTRQIRDFLLSHEDAQSLPANNDYLETVNETKSIEDTLLYEWVRDVNSKQRYRVVKILEDGKLICINSKTAEEKTFEQSEVELYN